MALFKTLRRKIGSTRTDHAETADERSSKERDEFRRPNARTDAWYDSRGDRFVDEGRPRH